MTLRAKAKQAHICSAIMTVHESVNDMKRLAALGKLLIAEAFGSPRHLIEMAFVNDIVNDKTMFDDALSLPLSMTMSMESPNSTPNAS